MTTWHWIFAFVAVVVGLYLWQRLSTRGAGGKLFGNIKMLYQGPHEYREVSLEGFPHLDHGYYRRTAEALEALGFRRLGDVEDVTSSASGIALPTLIRTMVSGDGKTVAGICWVKVPGPVGLLLRLMGYNPAWSVDLETPLDNGHFLLTSNAQVGALDWPPEIHSEFMPRDTEPRDLWARHGARLVELERREPPVRGLVTVDLAESIRYQHQIEEIKARFRRKRPGLVSAQEMERLAGPGQKGAARALHAEMLRRQRAGSEGGSDADGEGGGRPGAPS